MDDYANSLLKEAFAHHNAGDFDKAEVIYNQLLNRAMGNAQLLYLLGDIYCRRGFNGLACNILHTSLALDPKRQEAWINLGVAFKREHQNELAEHAWMKALELGGNIEIYSNMSTLYADTGQPKKALEWLDKALTMDSTHWESHWNRGLALLSLRQWKEGWSEYARRANMPKWDLRSEIDAPKWDGSPGKTIYVHGEQGVGDEVMFLSCIPDLLKRNCTPVLEVHKKLEGLIKATWPDLQVFTNAKAAAEAGIKVDAKIGLGELPGLFRNETAEFPGKAYLKPDPALVGYYRERLARLGPGPYIAVAWMGGMKTTRIHERSFDPFHYTPLMSVGTVVCAQYGDLAPQEAEENGMPVIDDESRGADLHAQAALFAACDCVVTVVQTAVHIAGAVGTPAYVLTPMRPSWRYGVEGFAMPWYKSVRLFRQTFDNDWGQVIAQVTTKVENDFGRVSQTQRRTA